MKLKHEPKNKQKKTTKIWLKRSSLLEALYKNGVPRNFTEFTGKHLCQNLFFNKVAGSSQQLIKKARGSNTGVQARNYWGEGGCLHCPFSKLKKVL